MSGSSGFRGPVGVSRCAGRTGKACPDALVLLVFVVSLLLALLPLPSTAADAKADIRVLLRYDDYTRTSNFALEERLFRALDGMGVPLLVGAVPFPGAPYPEISASLVGLGTDLGPKKIALLRELVSRGRIEVALHGYSHRDNSAGGKDHSEFAGLSFDRQRQLLTLGKSAFEAALGVPVRTFIPPFNTYDSATVQALEQTGFSVLSADIRYAQRDAEIAFVPGTVSPQRMRQAIRNALQEKSGTSMIVIVMHNYDFVGAREAVPESRKDVAKIDFATLLEDIRWAKQQPGVTFASVEDLLRSREDLSAARVASNNLLHKNWITSHALLPAGLASPPIDGMLLAAPRADSMRFEKYAVAAGTYAGLLLAAYLLSRRLNRTTALAAYQNMQRKLALAMGIGLTLFSYLHGFYLAEAVLLVSVAGWYGGGGR